MKKSKIVSMAILLVLCVGMLVVGVYAATPIQNKIKGAITVNSVNPEIEIHVTQITKNLQGQTIETRITTDPYVLRSGTDNLNFGELKFATAKANLITDVPTISVRLDVTNKSEEDLGMYFATAPNTTVATETTPAIDLISNVLEASFTSYKLLPKTQNGVNGTESMTVTFQLKDFPKTDINSEIKTLEKLFFNVEKYNQSFNGSDNDQEEYVVVGGDSQTLTASTVSQNAQMATATKVKVAESVTKIDDNAFKGNTKITEVIIPDGVTSIGANAFEHCESLTSITIPGSVTSIGNGAFLACHGLTSIPNLGGVTKLEDNVFNNCMGFVDITIPNTITSMGNAFINCRNLTSITIPSSVTSIGPICFYLCEKLATVYNNSNINCYIGTTSPGGCLTRYATKLYKNGELIEEAIIENNVRYVIGNDGQKIARGLVDYDASTVVLANDCKGIGEDAFYWSTLTSITIPEGVTGIGDSAFFSCDSLTQIDYAGTVEQWNAISKTDANIPAGVVVKCTNGNVTIS